MKIASLLVSITLSTLSSSQFVTRNGLEFELDGASFTFAGANSWDIGFHDEQHITSTLNNAKQAGLPVLRVAAWNMIDLAHGLNPGNVYYEAWDGNQSTINYGATGLNLLDSAVQQAEKQGIKYIMCLTNNWNDFGGMPTYVRNMLGDGQSQTNFYNNPLLVNKYKDYVTAIVTRYKDSPAIFSWELANEARCQESNCNGTTVLTTWASTLSTHIKTLDPLHLVTFGGYGYMDQGPTAHNWDFNYDGQSGESFAAILALPTIDFGTVHLYTNDNSTGAGPAYGLQWLIDHNDAAVAAGKPMIVEELGVNSTSPEISQTDVLGVYEAYMASGDAKAIRGAMLWSCDVASAPEGAPPCGEGDIYAVCHGSSGYQALVPAFAATMAGKANATL